VSKTYRPYEPGQAFLLPPSPQEWLPTEHLAYFVMDTVAELDLGAITRYYERELRGYPPYDPRMMLALLMYGYCVGVRSSRQIEKKTHEDVAFRVIAANQHPDHSRISDFRRVHLDAFADLFLQVLKLCQRAGLVKLGHVALDGTKMKANASKHKAMSYQRMKDEEERLRGVIEGLMREAEATDVTEDAQYGKDRHGDDLPAELKRAETRRARIRQLREELEAETKAQQEAKAQADSKGPDDQDGPSGGAGTELPSHRIPTDADGTPTSKAQRNFTDAESRIMKTGDGFVQGYNCQAVVDDAHQIIVAQAVTNQPPDVEHLPPLLDQTIANCGAAPERMSGDSGYYSESNVAFAESRNVDPYLATGRRKSGEAPADALQPEGTLTPKQHMTRKLATEQGRAVYARRKVIVEPVFGQIKAPRGIRVLLLRGVVKARAEWALITATHNLLKLRGALMTSRPAFS